MNSPPVNPWWERGKKHCDTTNNVILTMSHNTRPFSFIWL